MSVTTAESIRVLQEIIVQELPRWMEEQPALRRLVETLAQTPVQEEGARSSIAPHDLRGIAGVGR